MGEQLSEMLLSTPVMDVSASNSPSLFWQMAISIGAVNVGGVVS